MEPEKLKELISNFALEIGKAFNESPHTLVLPKPAFDCFLRTCPDIMAGDPNSITWYLVTGPLTIRRG